MKKLFISLLFCSGASIFASATTVPKKIIATATLTNDKNYFIVLANGFRFEIADNKQVAPVDSGYSDGRCYTKSQNSSHLGTAHNLLWSKVTPAANALKKANHEQQGATEWRVFDDGSVEKSEQN